MTTRFAATLILATLAGGCAGARVTTTAPQPAAMPASTIAFDQRVVAYPHGRWVLYGEGSSPSPYTWVWVPTGTMPPPPTRPAR